MAQTIVTIPETTSKWPRGYVSARRVIIGAILGVGAMILAFRGADLHVVWKAIEAVDWRLAFLGFLSVVLGIAAVASRWWLLFYPDHARRSWLNLLRGVIVGQSVNLLLPARLGEVARIYFTGLAERISKTRVLSTIIVERVTDTAAMALGIVILVLTMSVPVWMKNSGIAFIILAIGVVVVAATISLWGEAVVSHFERTRRIGLRIIAWVRATLIAFRSLRSWRVSAGAGTLAVVILGFSVLTNYLLIAAMGIHVPVIASLFLLIVMRVGAAPPSLPGRLGVFHYFVVLALSFFGVDRSLALACAFLIYAVVVLPVLACGIILGASSWPARDG
jgi:uncharacterized protein (TIRG00374 family)